MFTLNSKFIEMASRCVSVLAQWCSRVFMVEISQKTEPIYFALSSKPTIDSTGLGSVSTDSAGLVSTDSTGLGSMSTDGLVSTDSTGLGSVSTGLGSVFSSGQLLSVYAFSDNRVESARCHVHLRKALTEHLPAGCDLIDTLCFLPEVKNSVVRGFLLRDKKNSNLSAAQTLIAQLQQKAPLCVFRYTREETGNVRCTAVTAEPVERERTFYVTPARAPQLHPSTLNIINSDVFYHREHAYRVLEECSDIIPESKSVLELVNQQQLASDRTDTKFPVIVIEGLDATGKTTLTSSLQKALDSVLLKSPPDCLAHFRQRFDAEPPLIRRAFYALGNYITAAQIARASSHAPVIVDRYWHSTAAYAIATAVSGPEENLPPAGSEFYEWPSDLLRPSLVLLLSLSPEERLRRLTHRGLDKTDEENQLEINHLFRRKVDEAYKRIQNPACVVVDASPSPDHLLQQVLCLIRNKCNM